jgi:hypothetical protein
MRFCEILLTIQGYRRRTRESWEQSRLLRHLIASVLSSNPVGLHEFQPFPWDETEEDEGLTEEEKKQLLQQKEDEEREQRHELIQWAREYNAKRQ